MSVLAVPSTSHVRAGSTEYESCQSWQYRVVVMSELAVPSMIHVNSHYRNTSHVSAGSTEYESCQLAVPKYKSRQCWQYRVWVFSELAGYVDSSVSDSYSVCHCGVAVNTGRTSWSL